MEQKLTKTQVRTLTGLAIQKKDLQDAFNEIIKAEQEQIAMLATHYNLPDGKYSVKIDKDGDAVITDAID